MLQVYPAWYRIYVFIFRLKSRCHICRGFYRQPLVLIYTQSLVLFCEARWRQTKSIESFMTPHQLRMPKPKRNSPAVSCEWLACYQFQWFSFTVSASCWRFVCGHVWPYLLCLIIVVWLWSICSWKCFLLNRFQTFKLGLITISTQYWFKGLVLSLISSGSHVNDIGMIWVSASTSVQWSWMKFHLWCSQQGK